VPDSLVVRFQTKEEFSMKKRILAALVGCAMLVVSGCTSSTSGSGGGAEKPIVIGVIAPLTGSKSEQGAQFKEGAELAVKEINAQGGVLGRQVKLEILDDQGKPNEAASAAQKLAANGDVVAVIGPSSTASSGAAIPILEKAKLVAISPSASTGSLVTDNKYFFIMSLPAHVYGPSVPEYAVKKGAKSLAILNVKDDWGESVTKISKEWAEQNNVPVVAEASYTQGARDFKAQLTSLLDKKPEALVLNTHYTEGALITKQVRDLGFEGTIVAQGTNTYPQFIELSAGTGQGVIAWTDFLASLDNDSVRSAVAKFKDGIGKEPLAYHINTYDAMGILFAAIKQAGGTEDRDKIAQAVGTTKNFPGIVGSISYGPDRLPQKDLFWVTVKGGEWVLDN
jgi:branched-chain amino acid transport system substrate-binding protein